MEFGLLEHRLRRLVQRLDKHNRSLEIFDHNDIIYGEIIGRGGEGVVQRCTVTYNGLPVDAAVKILNDNSDDAIGITLDEIEMLCLGTDPIIHTTLQVYGVAAVPNEGSDLGHLVIITEAGIMNALQLYQEYDIPMHVTFDLWSRIAAAIHLLHTKKILHQDIKPDNILITGIVRDSVGQIKKVEAKIIDLGMGKRLYTTSVITDEILGTNGYHPPEVLLEDSYDFRADVFMLGVTFCVLLHNSDFLKKRLNSLLKQLHEAKKQGKVGHSLYDKILCQNMDDSELPANVRTMIISMLEHQDKRTVELAEIVEICRNESRRVEEEQSHLPPILSPIVRQNDRDQDSGFSSHLDGLDSGGTCIAKGRTRRQCTYSGRYSSSRVSHDASSTRTDRTDMSVSVASSRMSRRRRKRRLSSEYVAEEQPLPKRVASRPDSPTESTSEDMNFEESETGRGVSPMDMYSRVKRVRRTRSDINYALL